ncbi:protein-export chaperone SecB [Candidatus Spongiihabitans sp.]|uniref:protein-export chaperone SecB n=1 Tax=Candidatus Spongiihabitans sp. TaxID=3101308 RepID=UPI003C79D5DD
MAKNKTDAKPGGAAADQTIAIFDTKKVYLKDVSFEAPSTPVIFTRTDVKPAFDIQTGVTYTLIDENLGIYDIVLKVTVTTKHEDIVLYLAEIHQAGVFQIQHSDTDKRQTVIEVTCPHILLPFAREELNSLITKGGFSAFLLPPVNFGALFRKKQELAIAQTAAAEVTDKPN